MIKKNCKNLRLGKETVRALQTNDLVRVAAAGYTGQTNCNNNCPPKDTGTW